MLTSDFFMSARNFVIILVTSFELGIAPSKSTPNQWVLTSVFYMILDNGGRKLFMAYPKEIDNRNAFWSMGVRWVYIFYDTLKHGRCLTYATFMICRPDNAILTLTTIWMKAGRELEIGPSHTDRRGAKTADLYIYNYDCESNRILSPHSNWLSIPFSTMGLPREIICFSK